MGRAPCCDKANVKRGPWSPEEDAKLKEFIDKFGTGGNWISLPQKAGLKRCGKSCRLRWLNYLRPNIKHGEFSDEEDRIICTLYASIGSRWSIIAAQLPGRTDNDIKNYWNTKLKKKLISMINPLDQRKLYPQLISSNALQTSSSPQSLYEAVSVHPSNLLYNNNNNINNNIVHQYSYLLQNQEMLNINPPMKFYSPGGKDTTNMLVFGGGSHDQGSCSSSDGSCSQISYGKEMKQEPYNGNFHHHQGYNNISSNNNQENHEFVLDYGNNIGGGTWNNNNNNNQKQNVFSTNNNSSVNQLEYDLEEVKQLISSSSNNNNNNNNIGACNNSSFFITSDENNKAQHDQRGMFYY